LFFVGTGAFVVYTEERELTRSPEEPSASSVLQEYLLKKKNEAYSKNAVTSL
jgi:hypothetical protein